MNWSSFLIAVMVLLGGCRTDLPINNVSALPVPVKETKSVAENPVQHSEDEWRKILDRNRYHVLREKGTEAPFTGEYWNHKAKGTYLCAGCGAELFQSSTKYESGCGWPSFWQELDKDRVELHADDSHGMHRTEVTCKRCGGHLGHVFDDGPPPTGKRFCINSASLQFRPAE